MTLETFYDSMRDSCFGLLRATELSDLSAEDLFLAELEYL